MHRFPNHILGKWMRVFCTMAESKDQWALSGYIEDWARIIGENVTETRKFINYVIDNFPSVRVELKVIDNRNYYTMMELFYRARNKISEVNADERFRNSININRVQKMNEILASYHPAKLEGRNSRFKKEFLALMREASRGVRGRLDRTLIERDLANEILKHIEFLSQSPEWKTPSKLLSLKDYIMLRGWASSGENLRLRKQRTERLQASVAGIDMG